jgi:hypothetical protein
MRTTLDVDQTVRRIADERLWDPVTRPEQDRWLDLSLVLDVSASMGVWMPTLTELRQLLLHLGAFGRVNVWSWNADLGLPNLYPGTSRRGAGSADHPPRELIAPDERHLILVLTDCVSAAWRSGETTDYLVRWAKHGPVALVQVLPEPLWSRTALSSATPVRLYPPSRGSPNSRLSCRPIDDLFELDDEPGRPTDAKSVVVPVLTLEPRAIRRWARMLAGAGGAWAPGYRFEARLVRKSSPAQPTLEGERAVRRFLKVASKPARKLARLLAAAPLINLPVIRTLREKLLPQEAGQAHEAEVFLGGLLRSTGPTSKNEASPEEALYDFRPGVRELLLDRLPGPDKRLVLQALSSYIEDQLGFARGRFRMMLADPKAARGNLTPSSAPVAHILADVLRRIGGDWKGLLEPQPDEPPTQEGDWWPRFDDLVPLPHWAIVAFLARCCRRIQPLFSMALPNFSAERQLALDRELDFAERVAAEGGVVPKGLTSQALASEGILRDLGYSLGWETIPPTPPSTRWPPEAIVAAHVARAINGAAMAAQASPGDTNVEDRVNAVLRSVSRALRCAVRSSFFSRTTELAARREVLADLERLQLAVREPTGRFPPELFGPFWPDGVPESWPVARGDALPLKEELAKLPCWAVVALATRCVQRVEPLFRALYGKRPENAEVLAEFVHKVGMAAGIAKVPEPVVGQRIPSGPSSFPDRMSESTQRKDGVVVTAIMNDVASLLNDTVQLAARVGIEDNIWLTAEDMRALRDALLDAFPRGGEIPRVLAVEMGVNLSDITPYGPLNTMLQNLIVWSHAHGRVGELVRAAQQYNPSNLMLNRVAKSMEPAVAHEKLADFCVKVMKRTRVVVHLFFSWLRGSAWDWDGPGPEVGPFDAAARSDFRLLRDLAQREKWDDRTPVSQDVFGPLWPDGLPNGWPRFDEAVNTVPAHETPRRWVQVAGLGWYELPHPALEVCPLLGEMLAREGYGLIVGGFQGVDHVVARRFVEALDESRPVRADSEWLIQVVARGRSPNYPRGRIVVTDGEAEAFRRGVELADAVILVSGVEGTKMVESQARRLGKPVLPLATTGGAALEVYQQMRHPRPPLPVPEVYRQISATPDKPPISGLTPAEFRSLELPVPAVIEPVADLLRKLFSPETPSLSESTPSNPDDPQKGQWGGQAERNGRVLQAKVAPLQDVPDWFTVRLTVRSTDQTRQLTGTVLFHLHPTFPTTKRYVRVESGLAALDLEAYGAFTVGAEILEGDPPTRLELDLATISAPERFKAQ